ncbi:MAG TPA: kelch repeat-containing protein, partial [Acidimicrobiales bacterium]
MSPPVTPPPLAYASAVYDSDNKTIVLFGGVGPHGNLSNDTWVWDGSTWTDYPANVVQAPRARRLASMAFDPKLHQLILFGGQGADGQPLGDTWAWNGASWYQETDQLVARAPNAREAAAMSYDGAGHLVLFGGTGLSSPPDPPVTSTTTTTTPPSGSPPAAPATPLNAAPASPAGAPTVLSDTWVWSDDGWAPVTTPGPSARSGAGLAPNPTHPGALLFGGEATPAGSASPHLLSDSWAWNGTSWAHLALPASPPARGQAVVAADGLTGGVIAFGGAGPAGPLNDTWLWNGTGWSKARTAGAPSPRVGAAAAFDIASRQLVVFGGVGPGGVVLGDTVVLTGQAPVTLGAGSTPTSGPARNGGPTSAPSSPSSRASVR